MRHRRDVKKFGRNTAHRRAMFRNMLNSLIEHERIVTTENKAKELRRLADRMVTLGKRGLTGEGVPQSTQRRRVYDRLRSRKSVGKLFDTLAPRYEKREGGYTRVIKLGFRKGDNASLAQIEFVEEQAQAGTKKKKKKKKKAAADAKAQPAKPAGKKATPSTKKEAKAKKPKAAADESPAEESEESEE